MPVLQEIDSESEDEEDEEEAAWRIEQKASRAAVQMRAQQQQQQQQDGGGGGDGGSDGGGGGGEEKAPLLDGIKAEIERLQAEVDRLQAAEDLAEKTLSGKKLFLPVLCFFDTLIHVFCFYLCDHRSLWAPRAHRGSDQGPGGTGTDAGRRGGQGTNQDQPRGR
jgi:hypothetical protein